MAPLVEIHTARLLPGIDPEIFRKINADLMGEILRVPGLVGRELLHDAVSGLWVDLIRWRSAEDREAAMAVFAANPRLHAFAQHLDPATMATVAVGVAVDLGAPPKA